MSNRSHETIKIGYEPRVDLLPPEVQQERKGRGTRRSLGYGVVAVAALAVLAIAGVSLLGLQSQVQLAGAQAETGSLLAAQKRFIEVRGVQSDVALVQAAQQVGASTEIDWKQYLSNVQATLPSNVTITSVTVDSATPMVAYSQPTAPLQGARIATISFEATSPTLPEVPTWLKSLASLPGFADALPGSVALDDTTSAYTAKVTMHVNEGALDGRFSKKEK